MRPGVRLLLIFFFALFSFSFYGHAEAFDAEPLSVKEALKLKNAEGKNLVILDVRTPAEYAGGHIPNAQNADFFGAVFEKEINRLDRDSPVLVYCQTGRRSEAAAKMLEKANFKKIYNLKGGIAAWEKANLPIAEEVSK